MNKMNRVVLIVAAAILALSALTLPLPAQASDSQTFWFDDIKSSLRLTEGDAGLLVRFASAALLSSKVEAETAELPVGLKKDKDTRVILLSISNGITRASVFPGAGKGVLDAILQAVSSARKIPNDWGVQPWVKLDIVQDVLILHNLEFSSPLPFDESLYGIALDSQTGAAFLPEELVSSRIAGRDHRLISGNLLRRVSSIANRQRVEEILSSGKSDIYQFGTTSVFFDGKSSFPLYRGHRIVNNVSKEELLSAAQLSGRYLSRAVDQEGKFDYLYEPSADDVPDGYNIIRHAGTIYAMLGLYQATGDQELLNDCRRAITYLLKQAYPCPFRSKDAVCIVENGSTKLGANALAALALAEYTMITRDRSYVPTLLKLGNSIISFQKENGEFFIQKQAYPEGTVSNYESDYYPGEALFALTRIYGIDPLAIWLEAAAKGARYRIRHGTWPWTWSINHDHWFLYALNDLYRIKPDASYLNHALRISHAITRSQNRKPEYPDWLGGWFDSPGSTPAATRTEGLCAAYRLARDFNKPRDAETILKAIRLGVAFELQTQFRPESVMYLDNPVRALGGFHASLTDYTVRIDYTQHNVSALLGYYRILDAYQPHP